MKIEDNAVFTSTCLCAGAASAATLVVDTGEHGDGLFVVGVER